MADIRYKIDEKVFNIFREPEIRKPIINIDWNPKTNDDISLPQDTNKDLQMALILAAELKEDPSLCVNKELIINGHVEEYKARKGITTRPRVDKLII